MTRSGYCLDVTQQAKNPGFPCSQVNAGAYAFEAANARHEHEYHIWETAKLLEGKVLIPGVITHASNIVEHPELIAERIARYAKLVGGKT